MVAILLFALAGIGAIWLAFQASGTAGVALAILGVLLLWCAFLAAIKKSGRLG